MPTVGRIWITIALGVLFAANVDDSAIGLESRIIDRTQTHHTPEYGKVSASLHQEFEAPMTRAEVAVSFEKAGPGEMFAFKGFTLMKLNQDTLKDDEVRFIEDEWGRKVQEFFRYELGSDDRKFKQYLAAKTRSFEAFDAVVNPLEREARKRFGNRIQLIMGNDTARLYQESALSYQAEVKSILGTSDFVRFENLKSEFQDWVYQKFEVGWNDLR